MYHRIDCEPAIWREIQDKFSFEVPGAKFTPAFKARRWDGVIRLAKHGKLYAGLLPRLFELCHGQGYDLDASRLPSLVDDFSIEDVQGLVEGLDLPEAYRPRDYQFDALRTSLRARRCLLLSPTASGKSLVIYALARTLPRCLVVVPSTSLVHQMMGDFADYGYSGEIKGIVAGEDRNTDAPIVVSTWQSIARESPEWVRQFQCVIVDEAHGAKAKSLVGIMEAAVDVRYRFGFTGTLDGTLTNRMVLEGLFGPVVRVITTRELMDRGTIAEARPEVVVLGYPDAARRAARGMTYMEEIEFIVSSPARLEYLVNLVESLRGNTLLLFTRVEQHGLPIYEAIKARIGDKRRVHVVHGGVDGEERDDIRGLVEEDDDAVVVCSYGTFSQGVNVRRVHNIVMASPYKSRIIVPQSIGRGLRMAEDKTECVIYDVADDLSWRGRQNHTLRHCEERVKMYAEMGLDYRMTRLALDG